MTATNVEAGSVGGAAGPGARLLYGVTPTAVPYTADPAAPSVVDLMVTATNATAAPSSARSSSSHCRSATATAIWWRTRPGSPPRPPTAPTGIDGADGTYTAIPRGDGTLAPGAGIAFFLTGVRVNGAAGSALILVSEDTGVVRTTPVAVPKTPPGLAITRFSASPIEVLPGGRSTLVWATTGAASCEIAWPGGSSGPLGASGSYDVWPEETTPCTLTATGADTVLQTLTVGVPAPYIVRFKAVPDEVPLGGRTTLSWLVANAAKAKLQPIDEHADPRTGTHVDTVAQTTRYSLEVESDAGTDSKVWTVDVMPVAIDSFLATPAEPVWPGTPSS